MSNFIINNVDDEKKLAKWIKVADENKINIKNTWNIPLINHFKNLDTFKENNKINFIKASMVLDGCMKVYSTRVDDVVENTEKLLENIHLEKDNKTEKKQVKKQSTGSKNKEYINIKLLDTNYYHNTIFRSIISSTNDIFLFDKLNNHFYLYDTFNDKSLIFNEQKLNIEPINKSLCPQLNVFSEYENVKLNKYDNKKKLDYSQNDIDLDSNLINISPIDITNYSGSILLNDINTDNLKLMPNTNVNKKSSLLTIKSDSYVKTQKIKNYIDFNKIIDKKVLYNKESTIISKKVIIKKKNKKSILLNDIFYNNTLYKMNINTDELFNMNIYSIPIEDVECNDLNSINSSNTIIKLKMLDKNDNEEISLVYNNNTKSSTNTKIPFKINMSELKLFLHKYINKTVNFITIKNELLQKHSNTLLNQITEPIYLMGLLHLATENNLRLINNSDNSVKIEQLT